MLMNSIKPISFAYDVINDKTGSLGIVINAANEKAHTLFKNGKITFNQFIPYIQKAITKTKLKSIKNFDDVFCFDEKIRKTL